MYTPSFLPGHKTAILVKYRVLQRKKASLNSPKTYHWFKLFNR